MADVLPHLEEQSLRWFAVSVKSRSEKNVGRLLTTKGYEQFVPTYTERHRWSDRYKHVEIPLFTKYVFCRFDGRSRSPILTTPGVLSIVGTQAGPVPIDQDEIEALKQAWNAGATCQPWPFLPVGARVRVQRGPLAGLEGFLVQFRKDHRLVLSVTLLQRSVAVELDATSVERVPEHRS
jgi:transcription antitermination factor NusG